MRSEQTRIQSQIPNRQWQILLILLAGLSLVAPARAQTPADLLAPKAFRAAVDKVLPSVVTIETYGSTAAPKPKAPAGRRRRGGPAGISKPGEGPTTGIIVSPDGLIITSTYNFLRNQPIITVILHDQTQHVAKILGRDDTLKLCLLKIEDVKDLPVAPIVVPRDLKVGQWAISLGFGYGGNEPAISAGVISATRRIGGRAVQTDANLSPANYGGPLIDIDGNIIGICVPLSPQSRETAGGTEWYDSGIGFAIPLHGADSLIKRMAAGAVIKQGWLGVRAAPEAHASGGVVIDEVAPDSPAAKAGLKKGDVITAANDQPTPDSLALNAIVSLLSPGDALKLAITREKETLTLTATLVDIPAPGPATRPATRPVTRPIPKPRG